MMLCFKFHFNLGSVPSNQESVQSEGDLSGENQISKTDSKDGKTIIGG